MRGFVEAWLRLGCIATSLGALMVWPAWNAGQLGLNTCGFPLAPWAHLVPRFPALNRKLRLALPCIGLDGIGSGLKEMEWDGVDIVHAFDVDPDLIPVLQVVHGYAAVERWNIGPSGDLLAVDEANLLDVDVLIAGPPCPPWSSIGLHGGSDDVRAQVFFKTTAIIIDQARRGVLLAFVIEMVPGMAHVVAPTGRRGDRQSYYDKWSAGLKRDLPDFDIHSWSMQTSDYLPQNRERLYTVGIRRAILHGSVLVPPTLPSSARRFRVELAEVLHAGLPSVMEDDLTGQPKANLTTMKRRLLSCRSQGAAMSCCISIDRDPLMKFGAYVRMDGDVCTLRTQNEMLWILVVDDAGRVVVSRCLHPVERLSLQGFSPRLAEVLSKRALLRCTGNACTAPVITSVLRQLLLPMACPSVLGVLGVPRPFCLWFLTDEAVRHVEKTRYLNTHRHLIGIMDQMVRLEATIR